jgi:cytochrome c oxidase assembly protein subunit 15
MAQAIGISGVRRGEDNAVAAWLLGCAAMVFVMVVLGGLTRLTDSGLSMMEWRPLSVLPPLSDDEWAVWFERYKTIPQYQNLNAGMTLAGFKGIFWLEYLHRLWGRLIGVAFFLPFLWFLWQRRIDRRLGLQLGGIFVLGGLQGGMGWYMVASGFTQDTAVSQYRLAAHLAFAVVIYGLLLWSALGQTAPRSPVRQPALIRLRLWLWRLIGFTGLVMTTGAFVAGLRAGLIYNTFPLMGGEIFPPDMLAQQPAWRNFFENMTTVQFTHRWLAISLFIAVLVVWYRSRTLDLPGWGRMAMTLVPLAALLQVALGLTTLLLVVPVVAAAAHQAGAMILLSTLLWSAYELRGRD